MLFITKWRKGAYLILILNTAISAKKHNYLRYRDYRDSRHLDDSTIVRFGIAIYRDNLQYRAALTQQITSIVSAARNDRHVPSINSPRCKTASRLHRLLYTWRPLPGGTSARISAYTVHFIFIANKCIGLHFGTNDLGLSSLNFFLVGSGIFVYFG